MKLGYNTGYWSAGPPEGALEAVKEAERLGFDSVWTAEAYGSDALTPLAWWGAHTERIRLGTGIVQLSARTPAATAMAAMTLDHLSGGRFILGLGASGPQVVEGWYGQPYPRRWPAPASTSTIVRRIVARDGPVEHHGDFYDLPLQDGTGLGKALKSTMHPLRRTIPIFIAAEGPKNVALAAEICDGWLPMFFAPKEDGFYRDCLAEGFAASGEPDKADRFEVVATMFDHPRRRRRRVRRLRPPVPRPLRRRHGRPRRQLPLRGVRPDGLRGRRDQGPGPLPRRPQEAEAAAAIPLAMVEDVALVGPPEKIREELAAWRDTCLTTFLVSGPGLDAGGLRRDAARLTGFRRTARRSARRSWRRSRCA